MSHYCDTSALALAFWFPSSNKGFQCPLSGPMLNQSIFYYEAVTVCAAMCEVVTQLPHGSCLVVFTDNLNTMQMFNSLVALTPMNWMLISMVDMLLHSDIDFQVFHVLGIHDTVVDHLSCLHNNEALECVLGLSITSFQPPRNMLGAAKK
ncbi:hypothetical protein PAXRUDRAFT_165288 [Paxillus rubicundulus Ve08.2h10]|uniref:RNase H type-1 domain-containing protein n=1 Tax=Paxillus rubicundulus Ve08.2h10 TaxID=930991 RepID=A0A0D0DIQ0_9AGAM|nr:hypothetical protein PAXRUDRAFT_165288 [Paxillus rubicundulus Ve08.2h10]